MKTRTIFLIGLVSIVFVLNGCKSATTDQLDSSAPTDELHLAGSKSTTSDLILFARITDMQCPIKVDENVTVTECKYYNNTIKYTASVLESPDFGRVDEIDLEIAKIVLLNEWVNSGDSDMEEVLDMLIKANVGLEYVYIGKPYGDRATISISSQELAAARKELI